MYFLLLLLLVKVRYEVTIRLLRTYRPNPKATLVILILKEIMYNPKDVIQGELLATSSNSKCLISAAGPLSEQLCCCLLKILQS